MRGSRPGEKQLVGDDRGLVIGGDHLCGKGGSCLLYLWGTYWSPEKDKGGSGPTATSAWAEPEPWSRVDGGVAGRRKIYPTSLGGELTACSASAVEGNACPSST